MTDWYILIDDVIAQYQLIFNGPEGDRRLPCEIDPEIISCHGIDKIQLCVCCIVKYADLLDKLHWVFIKKEGDYYFYPAADKEFENTLRTYTECNLQNNYLKNENLTSLYRTCEWPQKETLLKTCDILTDMVFNMNRRGRSKEELNKFNALFCCMHIGILQNFLFTASEYMEILDANEKLQFLREITLFLDKVLSARKYIDGKTKENDICEELRESCAITSAMTSYNEKPKAIEENIFKKFEGKMRPLFAEASSWRYTKNMRRRGNCRDIYRSLASTCLPNIRFDNTKNTDTAEVGRKDVALVKSQIDQKIK